MSHTINLHLTLHIERDGDVEYIREATATRDGRTNDRDALCSMVQQAINDELSGQDLPQEDGQ